MPIILYVSLPSSVMNGIRDGIRLIERRVVECQNKSLFAGV